jgi:GNAT superfamily N-acetyltransferase
MEIAFRSGELSAAARDAVTRGFSRHSEELKAPVYSKRPVNWTITGERNAVTAVLTAEVLWDWLYIDELWVSEELRGKGFGRKLMTLAEEFAVSEHLEGIWLWTQSWQAENFYKGLDYVEFTRFDHFPRGHSRIGLRKITRSDLA